MQIRLTDGPSNGPRERTILHHPHGPVSARAVLTPSFQHTRERRPDTGAARRYLYSDLTSLSCVSGLRSLTSLCEKQVTL